jgi:hypothetical protein
MTRVHPGVQGVGGCHLDTTFDFDLININFSNVVLLAL